MNMIDAAKWYDGKGFWVIPVGNEKKPKIKWKDFQDTKPTPEQIAEWWKTWPDANIGLITGVNGGLIVLDVDTKEGNEIVSNLLSDTFQTPTARTPGGGWHYYFEYKDGLANKARVMDGCDIRTDGGYIIAPPSQNGGRGKYAWLDGLGLHQVKLAKIPSSIYNKINSSSSTISRGESTSGQHLVNKLNIDFKKGKRDETLFHIAHCCAKGGMVAEDVKELICYIASTCSPPFPKPEAIAKAESAFQRKNYQYGNFTQTIKDIIESTFGNFSSTFVQKESTLSTSAEKRKLSAVLSRMVSEGYIERVGDKNGVFRRVIRDIVHLDPFSASEKPIDIKYPLGIHKMFETLPRNIIVIAGTQDSGKTAFMMRIALMNMNKEWKIRYMSSEMSEQELRKRLLCFEDIKIDEWKAVEWVDISGGYKDKIIPDGINIIDYLEISDNFYRIGEELKYMYDTLTTGIVAVALQKDFKNDLGRGGSFSLEKPRLYLTLTSNPPDGGIAKIVKCKNWRSSVFNPNNRECSFKIRYGNEIRQLTDWEIPQPVSKRKGDNEHTRKDLH